MMSNPRLIPTLMRLIFFSNRLLPFVFKDTKIQGGGRSMHDNNITITRKAADTITLIKCQISSNE